MLQILYKKLRSEGVFSPWQTNKKQPENGQILPHLGLFLGLKNHIGTRNVVNL